LAPVWRPIRHSTIAHHYHHPTNQPLSIHPRPGSPVKKKNTKIKKGPIALLRYRPTHTHTQPVFGVLFLSFSFAPIFLILIQGQFDYTKGITNMTISSF
jgi:hypothetical protein